MNIDLFVISATSTFKRVTEGVTDVETRECHGFLSPYGYQVRVSAGTGAGHESHTRDLSNESKNIIFGSKLNEIQLIYLNQSYLLHFWSKNHVFGLILTGNPWGLRVRVPAGAGAGGCPITRG